jgi:hypothetical protein
MARCATPSRDGDAAEEQEQRGTPVNLNEGVCEVLDDYIKANHPHVEDDHGRMPLLGIQHGRAHRTTLMQIIYTLTRLCHYANECPHGRLLDECEATTNDQASKCPSSVSPYAIRRGSIMAHRNANVPKDVASDRMDISGEVLDKHYDMAPPDGKTQMEE